MSHIASILAVEPVENDTLVYVVACCGEKHRASNLTFHNVSLRKPEDISVQVAERLKECEAAHAAQQDTCAMAEKLAKEFPRDDVHRLEAIAEPVGDTGIRLTTRCCEEEPQRHIFMEIHKRDPKRLAARFLVHLGEAKQRHEGRLKAREIAEKHGK